MKPFSKLVADYERICADYIARFEQKQGLVFEFWAGDIVAGVAGFGDWYFNFQDIVWDLNYFAPKGLIKEWQEKSLKNPHKQINYMSYTKGMRFDCDVKKIPLTRPENSAWADGWKSGERA